MADSDIHTSNQGDRRVNNAEANECATVSARTGAAAQAAERDLAIELGVEHVTYNQDGQSACATRTPAATTPAARRAERRDPTGWGFIEIDGCVGLPAGEALVGDAATDPSGGAEDPRSPSVSYVSVRLG